MVRKFQIQVPLVNAKLLCYVCITILCYWLKLSIYFFVVLCTKTFGNRLRMWTFRRRELDVTTWLVRRNRLKKTNNEISIYTYSRITNKQHILKSHRSEISKKWIRSQFYTRIWKVNGKNRHQIYENVVHYSINWRYSIEFRQKFNKRIFSCDTFN